jgi:hypothetical protein
MLFLIEISEPRQFSALLQWYLTPEPLQSSLIQHTLWKLGPASDGSVRGVTRTEVSDTQALHSTRIKICYSLCCMSSVNNFILTDSSSLLIEKYTKEHVKRQVLFINH